MADMLSVDCKDLVACAETRPPEGPVKEPESVFAPGGPELPAFETLHCLGKLGIFRAGEAAFTFERDGDLYRTKAKLKTSGLVSLLYGVDIDAEGVAGAVDNRSRSFTWSTGGGKEEKKVDIRFDPATGTIRSEIRSPDGNEEITRTDPAARDPFAMIHALRRADLTPGRVYQGGVFTEWYLYVAEATVVGREVIDTPGGEFDTTYVRIIIRKVVDGVPETTSREMGVWLTHDNRRIPARMSVGTSYGKVVLSLDTYAMR